MGNLANSDPGAFKQSGFSEDNINNCEDIKIFINL